MDCEFAIDQEIAIRSGEQYFDLHNDFDFVGLDYRPAARTAILRWKRGTGSWVPANAPAELVLTFHDVANFAVRRRDDEMPRSEDDCLQSMTFTPPEFVTDFESCFGGYRSPDEHIAFLFQSGAALKVWAQRAILEVR
ncbi:MAG: hypothetical protein HYV96_16500 [Opitutae bacterium]|nr:hypothetical protein [Opitutae bacterium]